MFKILLSLCFIFGFFFFREVEPIISGKMKAFIKKKHPELVEKTAIFFKISQVASKVMSILCLVSIILIWTGVIIIPFK